MNINLAAPELIMAHRDEITAFLDKYLNIRGFRDDSMNGLQVQGDARVHKIALGVSASLEFFRRSADACADMAVTHHGLLWSRQERITGQFGDKVRFLIANNMSLAAYHLPLDGHPVIGHNRAILRYLGARSVKPFGDYHEKPIGFQGTLAKPLSVENVCAILRRKLASSPQVFSGGPAKIRTVAVVSGGAASMLGQALGKGIDLYVTGEPSEYVQEQCRE
ncbi:MAG: Nif3-like dinuclear metal center hexameric protein, partial [Elusimicrobia bacterium]|nr:Nif3-like dinuclear metal center hexameric protein [Elusimicrobiota bacterium]